MADFTANQSAPVRGNIIIHILTKLWNGLVIMGEASAKARLAQALSEISDEELAQRGLTRQDVAKRIFTDGYHI